MKHQENMRWRERRSKRRHRGFINVLAPSRHKARYVCNYESRSSLCVVIVSSSYWSGTGMRLQEVAMRRCYAWNGVVKMVCETTRLKMTSWGVCLFQSFGTFSSDYCIIVPGKCIYTSMKAREQRLIFDDPRI